MLELFDPNQKTPKGVYQETFPQLEAKMAEWQRRARAAGLQVVIVFEGWDAAGKGSVINRLAQVLDPRGFEVHAITEPNSTEIHYPWMWRFWNQLPKAGTIGIFDQSWYERVLFERVEHGVRRRQWKEAYDEITQFERLLTDSGTVLVKFWLHIDQKEQKRRFERLESTPATSWKVGPREWDQNKKYDAWCEVIEDMLARTSTAAAPWTVVESKQGRFRRMKVFETIIQAIDRELEAREQRPAPKLAPMPLPKPSATRSPSILDRVDTSLSLEREEYKEQLDVLQERLFRLEHELYVARVPVVLAYEGWDAAGKGGNIRRLTRGLDPRGYRVVPVAAPTDEEKNHHYLWRFWKALPKAGHITIFDRTWYGRLLVERVEGFCSEEEWQRAFREINEFERQVANFGAVFCKFWLHIDREEQLRRFEARQNTPDKQWKITDEDWRNREKWDCYELAVNDMLRRTSTTYAPWTVLEANCKLYARIKALKTIAEAIETALDARH